MSKVDPGRFSCSPPPFSHIISTISPISGWHVSLSPHIRTDALGWPELKAAFVLPLSGNQVPTGLWGHWGSVGEGGVAGELASSKESFTEGADLSWALKGRILFCREKAIPDMGTAWAGAQVESAVGPEEMHLAQLYPCPHEVAYLSSRYRERRSTSQGFQLPAEPSGSPPLIPMSPSPKRQRPLT